MGSSASVLRISMSRVPWTISLCLSTAVLLLESSRKIHLPSTGRQEEESEEETCIESRSSVLAPITSGWSATRVYNVADARVFLSAAGIDTNTIARKVED